MPAAITLSRILRLDCLDCLQPRTDVFLSSVVHALSLISSTHEHRLDDDMSVEGFHVFYDTLHVIGACGPVCLLDICLVHCVQLQDVVIYPHQGIMNLLPVNECGIAQHAHFRLRTIFVSQADGLVNNLRKMWMTGRLSVAGKCQYVRQLSFCLHLLQFSLQFADHFLPCRHGQGRATLLVEATLAIDTVKRTHLTIGRQQVDAQRDA